MTRDRAAARRALLRRLLAERAVTSQAQAVRLLARHGHPVTQATVSRDLAAIGVSKTADRRGGERYSPRAGARAIRAGAPELVQVLREFVVGVAHSGNLALLRTPPGAAPPVASALDRTPPPDVLGTVAGDDTVLVVSRTHRGGALLARRFTRLLEGTSR
jgi:transcriptional regulator of arginine metabolism